MARTHGFEGLTAAAALLLLSFGVQPAAAQQPSVVGRWQCTGEINGLTLASSFDYRADGSYTSTQRISGGADFIEGGGGGHWRLEGDVLHDTKEHATLDRFVRAGVDVPPSDPEFQRLYAQSQANIGTTTSGPIRVVGDMMYAGIYTCQRQR